MKKSLNNLALLAVAGVAAFSSCSKEMDFYNPNATAEEYAKNWEETFGTIDSQQDWNMATQVTANVNFSTYANAAKISIYTANPTNGGKLLGVATSNTTLKLDVVKGSTYLFVTAEDAQGNLLDNSYYAIENSTLNVGVATKAATRAASDVTLGESYTYEEVAAYTKRVQDDTYNLEQAKAANDTEYLYYDGYGYDVESWGNYYYLKFKNIYDETVKVYDGLYKIGKDDLGAYKYWGGVPSTKPDSGLSNYDFYNNNYRPVQVPAVPSVTYQRLNNVETSKNKTWKLADYMPIFGPSGAMLEKADNKYIYRDKFTPNVTFKVTGEVVVDFMFGGTQNNDAFGYYYWAEGEEPNEAVRYILMGDARPSKNISYTIDYYNDEYGTDGKPTGNKIYSYTSSGAIGDMELAYWASQSSNQDAMITGTSYKVPYFGNGTVSYDFPPNTHIAFFVVVGGSNGIDNPKALSEFKGQTNYSVRDHNLAFNRTFSGYISDNTNYPANANEGEIDAIAYKYNGQTFLGFEDRGGDDDMNDVVFFVNGAEPEGTIPEIPNPNPTPETNSWIIACEDLGNTDDWDFNDVVLQVSHVAGEPTAKVKPLAAGGTLKTTIKHDGMDDKEIHAWLGVTDGTYPMINTGAGTTGNGDEVEITVDSDNYTVTNSMGGFSIEVEGKDNTVTITTPTIGTAPAMMCLPGDWEWPKERTSIKTAYPSFVDWSGDVNDTDWIDSKDSSAVY